MMIRNLLLCLITLSLLFVAACGGDTPTESSDQGEKSGEILESEDVVVDREAVEREYHEQLAAMEEKLENIKAEMENASEEVSATYEEQVQELEQSIETMRTRLDEFGQSAEESWENLKTEIGATMEEMGQSLQEVEDKVKEDIGS